MSMNTVNVSFVRDELEVSLLAGSQSELGNDAGRITWQNAMDAAIEYAASFDGFDYDEGREYFAGYGAWDEEEIAGWSEQEIRAMVIQEAAASLRETEAGGEDGRTFEGEDGELYMEVSR